MIKELIGVYLIYVIVGFFRYNVVDIDFIVEVVYFVYEGRNIYYWCFYNCIMEFLWVNFGKEVLNYGNIV